MPEQTMKNPPEKPLALYIHWPFCKSKCPYCDFNSHVRDRVPEQAFCQALMQEMEWMAARVPNRKLNSIFFGGGTPSLMSPDTVNTLIQKAATLFQVVDMAQIEITLEANPTSVEAEKFKLFRAAGVNRVSLGVQSLKAESLKFLGREHSANEAIAAVELAAKLFPRFSFDLIYALPNQTVVTWEAELKEALKLAGDHLSLYQLTIEENTAFHHSYHQKKAFALPVENDAARLYEITQEMMEAHDLPAYEISNHARKGFESQHNLAYWLGYEYIGIGAGAHGRLCKPTGKRDTENIWYATACIKSPERWLEAVEQHRHGLETNDALSEYERFEEHIMMRLRLAEPTPLEEMKLSPNHPVLQMFVREGLATINDDSFALTLRGKLVQHAMVGELLAAM
jgi:oxygen-independent coproporphyrinogen-3 oxidase